MSTLALIQILFNVVFILAVLVVWRKASRNSTQDDPRLSRGLQLLQSKIAILEDLSDRTDQQVKTLTALLERRSQSLQEQMSEAERHVSTIRKSMDQSLEVAKIFQDKIPHEEIIERKNTIKYVQAARLAHQGASLEAIRNQVDLPDAELDFLVKMNREGLMFSEEQLPSWAQTGAPQAEENTQGQRVAEASRTGVATTEPSGKGGQSLTFKGSSTLEIPFVVPVPQDGSLMERLTETPLFKKASEVLDPQPTETAPPAGVGAEEKIKRFEFPRLDPFGNLS
ncbi:MAG: DUF2802 domain-containing protein [Bdellovibrionales bacterium]|nr:DUF2802 domain-containing protein [Bdellovibrionales bacterium]